jgi:hypothetical protein
MSVHLHGTTLLLLDSFHELIFEDCLKTSQKNSSFFKIWTNNSYFTCRPMHTDDISLNSSNDRCFRQKSWKKSKQIFYLQYIFTVYEIMWKEHKMLFLHFHCNSGYVNMPHCDVYIACHASWHSVINCTVLVAMQNCQVSVRLAPLVFKFPFILCTTWPV